MKITFKTIIRCMFTGHAWRDWEYNETQFIWHLAKRQCSRCGAEKWDWV